MSLSHSHNSVVNRGTKKMICFVLVVFLLTLFVVWRAIGVHLNLEDETQFNASILSTDTVDYTCTDEGGFFHVSGFGSKVCCASVMNDIILPVDGEIVVWEDSYLSTLPHFQVILFANYNSSNHRCDGEVGVVKCKRNVLETHAEYQSY